MERLTEQQEDILRFIKGTQRYELTISKIAKELKKNYGNVLKAINKLESLGLIEKYREQKNKRIKIILTNEGKDLTFSYS